MVTVCCLLQDEGVDEGQTENEVTDNTDDIPADSGEAHEIPNGDDPVYAGASVTKGQLFAFVLRHCCTESALADLIKLFNTVIAGCLPFNLYFFKKLLNPSVATGQ